MLNQYIQSPYIILPFGLAKPALIITVIYMLLLACFLLHGLKKHEIKLKFLLLSKEEEKKLCKDERNKIIISAVGFCILVSLCIILPSFLDGEIIFLSICKVYLQYETIIYLGIFLFFCTSILNNVNRERQIAVSAKILQYAIVTSIGAGLLSGEIDYKLIPNEIVIFCAGILNFLLSTVQIEPIIKPLKKTEQFDMISYNPAQKADELFPKHKMQAKYIADIISKSSTEPFSICISGEWGKGKTSVMNGIEDILNAKENCNYEFIRINALELDNKQALVRYLFLQIKEKLKSSGAYVGIDSEFKMFISSTVGILTSNSIGDYIQCKFFYKNDDYRFQKNALEKVLNRAFKNGKLIVVVDDIERCEKAIAREYLFLIKEVATMRNCVSIFVTDYNVLNSIIEEENVQRTSTSPDFLNKFFDYKIYLRDESPEDILSYYDIYFENEDPAFQSIYQMICMSPSSWYQMIVSGIRSKLDKEKNNRQYTDEGKRNACAKKIQQLEDCLALFNRLIQNSRNVAKFYNVFRENIIICDTALHSLKKDVDAKEYISSRNIGQIVYVLSFTEIFLPKEYLQLIEYGAEYIEMPRFTTNEAISEERTLLIELVNGLIYSEYFNYRKPNSYIREDIKRFMETFLINRNDLAQLVNNFSSKEEEWLHAINEWDKISIENNWEDMILMILQKKPDIDSGFTNEKYIEIFTKLLDFSKMQIELGVWTSDKVFSIFHSKKKTDRLFAMRTRMLTTFWEHLQKYDIYKKPSENLVKEIKIFPYRYAWERITSMYRLAQYLIPFDQNIVEIRKRHEYILDNSQKYSKNISVFLDVLVQHMSIPSLKSNEWDEKYKELAEIIFSYLKQQKIADYPDVKNDIEHMLDSIDEFSSLEQILTWIENVDDGAYMSSLNFCEGKIEDTIQHFEYIFDSLSPDKKGVVQQQFVDFWEWLNSVQDLAIDEQQIERLHNLVTILVEKMGYDGFHYRRLLLNIAQNQKEMSTVKN